VALAAAVSPMSGPLYGFHAARRLGDRRVSRNPDLGLGERPVGRAEPQRV